MGIKGFKLRKFLLQLLIVGVALTLGAVFENGYYLYILLLLLPTLFKVSISIEDF